MGPQSHRKRQGAPPRKKACQSCTKSKVRCSLDRPVCSRCRVSGRACVYPALSGDSDSGPAEANHTAIEYQTCESFPDASVLGTPSIDPLPNMPIPLAPSTSGSIWHSPIPPHRHVETGGSDQPACSFNFADISLVPSANAGDIRDRWLRPYILPPLGQEEIPKVYHPFTLQYISRVLATYPRFMLKDGGLPPIIHWAQITGREMPRSLANCYSLVRLWDQAVPGSETMVIGTVEREMERLAAEPTSSHDFDHLSDFQAYFLYSIMMYFSPRNSAAVNDKTMITLMELAARTTSNGLFCTAEVAHTRPSWESWIVVAAKRRTILAMYLFNSVYNVDRLLPNFAADEMRGVYAPEDKELWSARSRDWWEKTYDRYLLDWEDGIFEISELWRSAETGSTERRARIERWAQTLDEFGMMIFGVCSHLHGC
ncbi:hypothetical protein BDW42DRAFT_201674 [Aspergillus taichungensis]|uniref:Zn(2)-C6 fungal-type domain-containing protein n=1 Tax=Aspergillus taichungensis TaxID=482145 RepID=A0A2J5HQA9_9EURO|nr:hypothetical protein BDW42DRAFT_201674 [Aspergillus taichungensis]